MFSLAQSALGADFQEIVKGIQNKDDTYVHLTLRGVGTTAWQETTK